MTKSFIKSFFIGLAILSFLSIPFIHNYFPKLKDWKPYKQHYKKYHNIVNKSISDRQLLFEKLEQNKLTKYDFLIKARGIEKTEKIELKKYHKKRKLLKKEYSFLGYTSFRYFLYAVGLPIFSLGISVFILILIHSPPLSKKIKKIYSIINYSFIYVSSYWVLHSFLTRTDFPKMFYGTSIVIVSLLTTIATYSLTIFFSRRKSRNEKRYNIALDTIENLKKEVFTKQKEEREKERQRISEELHDGVLGKLFGTRLGLGFLNIPEETDKEKYQQFLDELQEVEKEIREVSHKLSANLDGSNIGFEGIVSQLVKDKSKLGNFEYSINTDTTIDWNSVNEVNRVNLYRIIQEALQNIIKHAKASHLTLAFSKQNGHILISIEDNGVGFNTAKNRNGIGINNIKSRVKRLKATLELDSSPNNGTSLVIKNLI
ncbi:conserved membrane protein of unknown function [Tenacibaculum sp. 190524A02b]|uniref:sensor histidine kinase n=1 Tax=Tenacibaculum vairaonense TaxID=3137860 RepID=UPI0032B2996A